MKLLNFCIGSAQTNIIDGVEVQTAYIGHPVDQPWIITATGPAGNEVAVHTDHIYAYARDNYEYWSSELDMDINDRCDGFFAENLVFDTLPENALRLGDVLSLGSARLVVTGPRVPCWKLSWRLGLPKTFIRRFRRSGRTGVYFGVVEPGVVEPGDALQLISTSAANPSVTELAQAADPGYEPTVEHVELIEHTLSCDHLSLTLRFLLSMKLTNMQRLSRQDATTWSGWRAFTVDEVVPETSDVYSFHLKPANNEPLPNFAAGQHVSVELVDTNGSAFVRTWSLSQYQEAASRYRVTVKRIKNGRGVPALLDAAANGRSVRLRPPSGNFHIDLAGFRPIVFIAAGIGISPFVAMIQAHIARGPSAPPLWLIYGTRSPQDTALLDELRLLVDNNQHLHLRQIYSGEGAGDECPVREAARGRISAELVLQIMQDNYMPIPDGILPAPWFEADYYLCGPEAFNAEIRAGLLLAGANEDQVFYEDFEPAFEGSTGAAQVDRAHVTYEASGLSAPWSAAESQTLLELGEQHGLDLPFDCRSGSCHTCEARVVTGDVRGAVTQKADGTRTALLCVSYPDSTDIAIEA